MALMIPPPPVDLAPYLKKSEFDPAGLTQVWSGSSTYVSIINLQGRGWYLVDAGPEAGRHWIFYNQETAECVGTARGNNKTSTTAQVFGVVFLDNSIRVIETNIGSSVSQSYKTIYGVYKAASQ